MNGKLTGIIVAIVIIIVGIFFFLRKETNAPETGTMDTQNTSSIKGESAERSLKSLLANSESQECAYEDTKSEGKTSGIVYVGNGKMRSDFTTLAAGKTQSTHMISSTSESFVWIDGETSGFKMDLTKTQANSASEQQPTNQDTPVKMTCKPWKVDSSKFQTPSNIDFKDLSSMLPSTPASPSGQTSTQGSPSVNLEALCASLPVADRDACLAAARGKQ